MANVLIEESVMTGLADLLRESKGDDATYYPSEMEPAFRELISSGGGPDGDLILADLEVTENGTYTPGEGLDGFGKVVVNVPSEGGGITDFLTAAGYTVLFADGECQNEDLVTLNWYEVTDTDAGALAMNGTNAAGFWTTGATDYKIGVLVKFNGTTTIQYGTSSATGTLPTIISKGTGRTSFSTLAGTDGALQTFNISKSGEKFLGGYTGSVHEILAVYIVP